MRRVWMVANTRSVCRSRGAYASGGPCALRRFRHAIADVVATAGAGVRDERRTADPLRNTFCTMFAERRVALEVIRELASMSTSARRRSTST
jgi:hypothetical protein